jgi:hypothetical protein
MESAFCPGWDGAFDGRLTTGWRTHAARISHLGPRTRIEAKPNYAKRIQRYFINRLSIENLSGPLIRS